MTVATHDALMRRRDGAIAIAGDTAIIEVAGAAGLTLVEPERRNAFSLQAMAWANSWLKLYAAIAII